MKRSMLTAAALTAACLTLVVVGQVFTQTGAPSAGAGASKVAVVNIGAVFQKYEKAKFYKDEMEGMLKPFRLEAEKLKKEILDWKKAMEHPKFDPKERERYEAGIVANNRKLEDLDREARKRIGKKQEEQIVALYKEVNLIVNGYAQSNGIQLVLAYGDPIEGDHFNFGNINRKMQGMDLGVCNPMFFVPGADITGAIIDTLNRRFQANGAETPGAGAVIPTGLQK